ncbi:PIF1 family DEAD/DEAH box helicase [Acinetobacter sp. P1(2025)]|uniref:PIF1 family DEAD/DEAH box helicase n=1 Tax=Acinetobacter sp. P1(2025) TaxID=3446120 RepID=UPI003F53D9C9
MEQALALDILKSGACAFLTGQAGTGKSYTLGLYIKYLKKKRIRYAVTASTGIAASHLDGSTIHSWSGMGVSESLTHEKLDSIKRKKPYLADTGVLFIDEISMLHAKQLSMVDEILRYCRENDEPFGGMQVIVCGDFFQLPPVERNVDSGNAKFCFMSPVWVNAKFKPLYLTKQYRQNGDALTDILNEIRSDCVSPDSKKILKETKTNQFEVENLTRLYTHNIDVDRINKKSLKAIDGKSFIHEWEKSGNAALCDMIANQNRLVDRFEYKIGALVMFSKNHPEQLYSNGSCGVIVDVVIDGGMSLPVVKLTSTKENIVVEPDSWKFTDANGDELASITTLPLRLAWAITVHKSQGMTLDAAEMDLSEAFETGMGYVALSRLRSLDGMRLLGLNETVFSIAPIVRKADARFLELSNELEEQFKDADFKDLHKQFYKHVFEQGCCYEARSTSSYTKKRPPVGVVAEKNAQKNKSEIVAGVNLEKLAKDKNLSLTTVVKHVALLAEKGEVDLAPFKPKENVLNAVSFAVKAYLESGKATPFFKNNPLFVKTYVNALSSETLTDLEIYSASLFLDAVGEIKA